MTHYVYSAAPPEVYTPPPGVVVLPLDRHPAIVAESKTEKLPGEPRRKHRITKVSQADRVAEYLRTNPPADAYAIGKATGIHWQRVRWVILSQPDVFQPTGRVKVKKVWRTLWGLVETSRSTPDA